MFVGLGHLAVTVKIGGRGGRQLIRRYDGEGRMRTVQSSELNRIDMMCVEYLQSADRTSASALHTK